MMTPGDVRQAGAVRSATKQGDADFAAFGQTIISLGGH
jgi:hypothetical protein